MTKVRILLFFIILGFINTNLVRSQNSPPEITASRDTLKLYCPQTELSIADNVTIVDIDDTGTTAIYIKISNGYQKGKDQLILKGNHPTIIALPFDDSSGKLILQSLSGNDVLYSDFIAAIKNVVFINNEISPSGIREFSITVGAANYLPSTGHYYEFVSDIGITWTNAKTAAENRPLYYGLLHGYLATITSLEEAQLVGKQTNGAGWIGASDAASEGVWKWVTGPEAGTQFWQGSSTGNKTPPFNFAFWNNGEPNNLGDEDYAHITAIGVGITGSWNDLKNTGDTSGDYQPKGYLVEYGGMPGDPILKISASTKIIIPTITSTTNSQRCGSGLITLKAASNTGNVNWYTNPTGGISVWSGTSYAPNLTTSTSYYVDAIELGCVSFQRTVVTATINQIPQINPVLDVERCSNGIVTLNASADFGTVNWFDSSTATTPLKIGNTFTTPFLSNTTTYYVEAINAGCSNGNRIAIKAIINQPPLVNNEELNLCENQTVELDATYLNASYKWSTLETSEKITVDKPGDYTVTITDLSTNCSSLKTFKVNLIKSPKIKEVLIDYNTITVITEENGDYEFSIDNGDSYQNSNVFLNVKGGLKHLIVREMNGCGSDYKEVILLVIPKFITPNNDGKNDIFKIEGLENYPDAEIHFFDRFGKLLYLQNLSTNNWDGTYNGKQLPSSDYWYIINLAPEIEPIKGHFSIKRN